MPSKSVRVITVAGPPWAAGDVRRTLHEYPCDHAAHFLHLAVDVERVSRILSESLYPGGFHV